MKKLIPLLLLAVVFAVGCGPTITTPGEPPAIISFGAVPPTISAGESSTLRWEVLGAAEVSIDQGIGNVALSGSRAVMPSATTAYTLTATNAAGVSATAMAQVTVSVAPSPPELSPVIYDFVERAGDANVTWRTGPPAAVASFGGSTSDPAGFACYRTSVLMEDGKTYEKVLETHPKLVNDGFVRGYYDINYEVEAGTHFIATMGLIHKATAGDVQYKVVMQPEGLPSVLMHYSDQIYNGYFKTVDVEISPEYVGKKVDFELSVSANGPSTEDWAAWVEAKLVR